MKGFVIMKQSERKLKKELIKAWGMVTIFFVVVFLISVWMAVLLLRAIGLL